jgi:arylsulfatase A
MTFPFRLVVTFLLFLFAAGNAAVAADPPKKPNIVVILADDLGYECLGCNGGTSYKTPNLDKLASTGMRFKHCYVQPLCTPTRVQLMTGLYNVRNYSRFGQLDPGATTFANLLKKAGYATGMVGKWQLGNGFGGPKMFGFDEYCLWQLTRRPPRYANPGLEINGKEIDYKKGEYGPDLVSDYALDFLARKKDQPFFLYYAMMLPHPPFQPTPDSADWDPKAIGEKVNDDKKHFADNIAYTDKLVGKLIAQLERHGLRDNTLVVFLGDNGTAGKVVSKMGDRTVTGAKGKTTSAGMHVPLIVNWPKVVAAGKVSGDLVDSTDFLPTICAAAGVPVPAELKIDGRSFLPQLRGAKGSPREWMYCWYAPNQGKRVDVPKEFSATKRYKLYRTGKFFDYDRDPKEEKALDAKALDAEAAAARKQLQEALDKYKDARPAKYPQPKRDGKQPKTVGTGSRSAAWPPVLLHDLPVLISMTTLPLAASWRRGWAAGR